MAKDKEYNRLILSSKWRSVRARKLSTTPLCERCQKRGIMQAAQCVHHIVPVEEATTYDEKRRRCYDYRNLMALCQECHATIHYEMRRATRQQRKERNKNSLDDFKQKFFG